MDIEINFRIGKASDTFVGLFGRVWHNSKLTISTKSTGYRVFFFCSTLLYGSETCTLSTIQKKKTFEQRCLRRIFRIRWQHKITNEENLRRFGLTTICTTLSQCRLRWLSNVLTMIKWIPKSLLYMSWSLKNVMLVDQDYVTYMFAIANWRA